jgi:hypothetical protein
LDQAFWCNPDVIFLQFNFKLVLFSSNFFDLGANVFEIQTFLVFWERLLRLRECSPRTSELSPFWQEGFAFPGLALHDLHFLLKKLIITAITAINLPVLQFHLLIH